MSAPTEFDSVPVVIYADGACRGNPGPGGWGVWLVKGTREAELKGGLWHTTNNEMELTAAIEGLRRLTVPSVVNLHSDSQYVIKGMTEWLAGWKKRGWKKADKSPVLNLELWQELDRLAAGHRVTWQWVRGHSGNPGNERADRLANQGLEGAAKAA